MTMINDIEKAAAMVPLSDSVRAYLLHGRPVGGFLTAVFEGNLVAAATQADEINFAALGLYGRALAWHAPRGAYGSREKVAAWIEAGGYEGRSG